MSLRRRLHRPGVGPPQWLIASRAVLMAAAALPAAPWEAWPPPAWEAWPPPAPPPSDWHVWGWRAASTFAACSSCLLVALICAYLIRAAGSLITTDERSTALSLQTDCTMSVLARIGLQIRRAIAGLADDNDRRSRRPARKRGGLLVSGGRELATSCLHQPLACLRPVRDDVRQLLADLAIVALKELEPQPWHTPQLGALLAEMRDAALGAVAGTRAGGSVPLHGADEEYYA